MADFKLSSYFTYSNQCEAVPTYYFIVRMVAGMINGQLSVRPSKIVAGHEPEKTNEFLQLMGMAILHKVGLC